MRNTRNKSSWCQKGKKLLQKKLSILRILLLQSKCMSFFCCALFFLFFFLVQVVYCFCFSFRKKLFTNRIFVCSKCTFANERSSKSQFVDDCFVFSFLEWEFQILNCQIYNNGFKCYLFVVAVVVRIVIVVGGIVMDEKINLLMLEFKQWCTDCVDFVCVCVCLCFICVSKSMLLYRNSLLNIKVTR